jgi:hypothetical protein
LQYGSLFLCWHQQLLVCLFVSHVFRLFVAWGGIITMAATNRNYGFKKNYNYFFKFILFYFNDLKSCAPKNTPPPPPQPTHQPTVKDVPAV